MSLDEEVPGRRKAIIGILPYVFNTYTRARSLLNPASIAMKAINGYDDRIGEQEEDLKAVLRKITNAKVEFEDGRIAVHLDKKATLGVVENYLRKKLALQSGATSDIVALSGKLVEEFDAEFRLPNRSIYIKIVTTESIDEQMIKSYSEKARSFNPSQVWLFGLTDRKIEVNFDPVFTERGILTGGFKLLGLGEAFEELIGKEYTIVTRFDRTESFVFLLSKSQ